MAENIIEVRNLTKKFGSFTAVNSIDFDIKKGEILGFLGPNGAGKTTTIKMINGLLKITGGQILIKGRDSVKHRKTIKQVMGYMSQKFSLYPLLNSLENIEFFGLMTDPEIIFLDEPTSGVDPEVRRNFWFEIYRLKKQGKTLLVSTHNLDEVEYADRMLILHQGNLLMQGEPEQLLKIHNKASIDDLFRDAITDYDPMGVPNKKFLEVQEPFFKKVHGPRRDQ